MPEGLIIMKFSERYGTNVLAQYPDDAELNFPTLMHLYGTHQYTGEAGLVGLSSGDINVASYYTGQESGYYVILILESEEDSDTFEEALSQSSRIILENLDDDAYIDLLPTIYNKISAFPFYTNEQMLASSYLEASKKFIIELLKNQGYISKTDLNILLKDRYEDLNLNVDSILSELIKQKIIKVLSVSGIASEVIFLTNIPVIIRVPPEKMILESKHKLLPKSILTNFTNQIKNYFKNYSPSDEDNLKFLQLIVDPEIYGILKLLRTMIASDNEIRKLKYKGVKNYERALKALIENNVVTVIEDKNSVRLYGLLSDIYITLLFPRYIVNKIISGYKEKSIASEVLIEYLNILETSYMEINQEIK